MFFQTGSKERMLLPFSRKEMKMLCQNTARVNYWQYLVKSLRNV
nr:unnamed protein product [Callosobruchus analis]